MVDARARRRVDLNPEDFELLEKASALFGMNRSEVVRRLLRAALEVSPALNAEASQNLVMLSHQLRLVGRNLAQIVRLVHEGRPVGPEESEQVWQALLTHNKEIDAGLTAIVRAHGLRLRRSAKLDEARFS